MILVSLSGNPSKNLAYEEFLFRNHLKTSCLLLYVNRPCVVIGRNQNPDWETAPRILAAKRIPIVRRFTGGGAVWHDRGNLNWSFIGPKNIFSIENNFAVILATLRSLGFDPILRGKRDILISGKKISGSAYAHTKDASLHHGTLLVRSDLHRLEESLRPANLRQDTPKRFVRSVRSETANLSDFRSVSVSKVRSALIRSFRNGSGPCPVRFFLPMRGFFPEPGCADLNCRS